MWLLLEFGLRFYLSPEIYLYNFDLIYYLEPQPLEVAITLQCQPKNTPLLYTIMRNG